MNSYKFTLPVLLIFLAVAFRTIWHIGDNIEFVTTAALVSGAYLGFKYAITVPLIVMMISDFFIGSTNIFVFTWSAYAVIGVMGYIGLRMKNQELRIKNRSRKIKSYRNNENFYYQILKATGFGVSAGFWFYLWTNFGVWLLDSWGMYSKDWPGLLTAYVMGLPFLKLNLIGNLFFVPLTFTIMNIAPVILNYRNFKTIKAVKLKI